MTSLFFQEYLLKNYFYCIFSKATKAKYLNIYIFAEIKKQSKQTRVKLFNFLIPNL